jgi:hypothetical protein
LLDDESGECVAALAAFSFPFFSPPLSSSFSLSFTQLLDRCGEDRGKEGRRQFADCDGEPAVTQCSKTAACINGVISRMKERVTSCAFIDNAPAKALELGWREGRDRLRRPTDQCADDFETTHGHLQAVEDSETLRLACQIRSRSNGTYTVVDGEL